MKREMRKHRGGPHVTVGVQGTEAAEDRGFGMSNVKLALVHEFGSKDGRVPQRSFIRSTIDRERRLLLRMLKRAARNTATYGNVARHLGIVGEKAQAEMVRTIDQSIGLKALAQSTIDRKGSTRPLLNTSGLKRSISYKVHA